MTPPVDVIIPAYRPEPAMLAEAIASAAASPLVARIIIIDDGSDPPVTLPPMQSPISEAANLPSPGPEGQAPIATGQPAPAGAARGQQHPVHPRPSGASALPLNTPGAEPHAPPPIEILRQPNAGPAAARNRGLRAATAPWVLMLDDDDLLIPAGLAAAIDLGEKLHAVGALAARIERTEGQPDHPKPAPPEWAGKPLPDPGAVFRPTVLFNGSGILLRRGGPPLRGGSDGPHPSTDPAALRFNQGLFVVEDREFLRRLADLGPIAISGDPMIITRRRPDGSNLTGGRHLPRRIRGHVLLLRKYLDPESAPWLRAQTVWLLNTAAKSHIDPAHWRLLARAAREAGWRPPLKSRLRRALRGTHRAQ